MEAEFKINCYEHRRNTIIALAESGYIVTVEERNRPNYGLGKDYYVIVRSGDNE